jgi:hypothetical protein
MKHSIPVALPLLHDHLSERNIEIFTCKKTRQRNIKEMMAFYDLVCENADLGCELLDFEEVS